MIEPPNQTDLAPGLLVAVPQLADDNFSRAVIYLVTHGAEGAFGLVLNRDAGIRLDQVCEELGIDDDGRTDSVYLGGPVETQRGFLLHAEGLGNDADSEPVEPEVYLSGTPEMLERCCTAGTSFRLFVGYAGWGPGQLESELADGSWLVLPSKPAYVLNPAGRDLWDRVLADAGIDPSTIAPGGGVN